MVPSRNGSLQSVTALVDTCVGVAGTAGLGEDSVVEAKV